MRGWVGLIAMIPFAACTASDPDARAPEAGQADPVADAASTSGEAEALSLTPERIRDIAGIAVQIERDPSSAAEVLAEHGITAEQLEAALYEIAEDPSRAEAFGEAKRMAYDR